MCEKCFKKHNFTQKYSSYAAAAAAAAAVVAANEINSHTKTSSSSHEPVAEFNCNICKKVFGTTRKLEEHLIEHSFHGCDDRGYTCYICSSVFTSSSGLHQHMNEHGPNSRPYDCNLCAEKFFFRTELENHLIDHEHGRVRMAATASAAVPLPLSAQALFHANQMNSQQIAALKTLIVKREAAQANNVVVGDNNDTDRRSDNDDDDNDDVSRIKPETTTQANDEDDEYIEIEKIGEHPNSDYDENSNAGDSAHSHHTSPQEANERETGDEKNQESDRLSAGGDDRSMRSESP